MKRVLIDTHVLLWWLNGDRALGQQARSVIANAENDIFVSAATSWEIAIKRKKGLLRVPEDMDSIISEAGFKALSISIFHAERAGDLPLLHNDPFDRMLIAQAQAEGLQLMSKDEQFPQYGINLINATK
jgi:PIN domain nuclease of toxin-antitoxin system